MFSDNFYNIVIIPKYYKLDTNNPWKEIKHNHITLITTWKKHMPNLSHWRGKEKGKVKAVRVVRMQTDCLTWKVHLCSVVPLHSGTWTKTTTSGTEMCLCRQGGMLRAAGSTCPCAVRCSCTALGYSPARGYAGIPAHLGLMHLSCFCWKGSSAYTFPCGFFLPFVSIQNISSKSAGV